MRFSPGLVLKLGMTVLATLLIYMGTFRQMAGVAGDPVRDLAVVRNASPIVHAILALILLLAATVLGVYKPFGTTAYGRRKHYEQRQAVSSTTRTSAGTPADVDTGSTPAWIYVAGAVAIALALLVVTLHLTGHVPNGHQAAALEGSKVDEGPGAVSAGRIRNLTSPGECREPTVTPLF